MKRKASRPLKVEFAKPEVTLAFLDQGECPCGFRMSSHERFYFHWIRFSGRRIGVEGEQLLVKAARRVHRKNRNVVHACAPFLPPGGRKRSAMLRTVLGASG